MVRVSNKIMRLVNFAAFVVLIPILGGGVWLATKVDSDCEKFLQWPAIAIGAALMIVALAGMAGACCRMTSLLWFYLAISVQSVWFSSPTFIYCNIRSLCSVLVKEESPLTVYKMLLFLSLFLYFALLVRVKFFRETMQSFSVIWWACAYPMTITSMATIKYAAEVRHPAAQSLALVLSSASIGIVLFLAVFTAMDLLLGRNRLFPDRI